MYNPINEGMSKNIFPVEIWEIIFSQLPIIDLFQCHSLVCKQWHSIIKNDVFLEWKKRYYKLKSGRVNEVDVYMQELCKQENATSLNNCLLGLLCFIGKTKFNRNKALSEKLKMHRKYSSIVNLFQERLPQVLDVGYPTPWSVIAAICILADNMWDIHELFSFLMSPKTDCTAVEVIEGLYCIATFLLFFQRTFQLPSRLHYQVYYALHLYENSWTARPIEAVKKGSPTKGQQAITNYARQISSDKPLTHEQMRIVNHTMGVNEIIKIVAFAGSGKTTTLRRLAESRPATNFLLVVFNKSTKEQASKTFPRNTKAITAHGLAYRSFGLPYKHKFAPNLKAYDITSSEILPKRQGSGNFQRRAGIVLKTLTKFLNSADQFITIAHVPEQWTSVSKDGLAELMNLSDSEKLDLAGDAELIWRAMIDKRNLKIKMTHDGYLKQWQLSSPDLVKEYKVSCILVDEAQDLNPAMLDVIRKQNCPRIIVGDPHQQIYQFRDAVNALNSLESSQTFYLTQSFRFGPEIGFVANACLEAWKEVANTSLVGGNIRDELESGESRNVAKKLQTAVIARTNFELFREAVQELLTTEGLSKGPNKPRIAFAGGFDTYDYEKLIDIWRLKSGQDLQYIKDPLVKKFQHYNAFAAYVSSVDDQELLSKIRIVDWAGEKVVRFVESLKKLCRGEERFADIVFSTVHKAKGLEWDIVRLLDDFGIDQRSLISSQTLREGSDLEAEVNLLYVAVTRAKKKLVLNTSVFMTLLKVHEKFERFRPSSDTPNAFCKNCKVPLPGICSQSKVLSLEFQPVHLSNSSFFPRGIICSLCAGHTSFRHSFVCGDGIFRELPDKVHEAFSQLVGPLSEELITANECYELREEQVFIANVFDSVSKKIKYWDFGEDDVIEILEDDDIIEIPD